MHWRTATRPGCVLIFPLPISPTPTQTAPKSTSLSHTQSITLSKLASLAELDEASLRAQLALMHASTQVVTWNGGDALAGTPQPAGDLDFALERGEDGQEMVVVQESRAAGASGSAFLVSHIQKLQDIVTELEGIVLAPAPGASAPAVAAN